MTARFKRVALTAGGLALVVAAGGIAGAAVGANERPPVKFAVNDDQETYGSLANATSRQDAPDLVLVEMPDGTTGYVRSEDLFEAEGWDDVSTPEEAVASMESRSLQRQEAPTLTVYTADGETVIGEWKLSD